MLKTIKSLLSKLFVLVFLFVFSKEIKAQEFVLVNPFETNYFIQNHGQFRDLPLAQTDSVYYAIENGQDAYYFLADGFIMKFSGLEENKEKREWIEIVKKKFLGNALWQEEQLEKAKIVYRFIRVKWLYTNGVVPVGERKASHYFTYGDPKFTSHGFAKLKYEQIYNGADLIFDIPSNGGVHYEFECKAGFDYHQIKWKYDAKAVLTAKGTIEITKQRDSVYEGGLKVLQSGVAIPSNFKLNSGNEIAFDIALSLNVNNPYTIDPFVTQINTLRSGGPGASKALDVDYDYVGNAFVFGGGSANYITPQNQRIAKFSPNGTHKWTFMGSVPSVNWESKGSNGSPGNFIVDKVTGKVYCGQGFENTVGTRIVRIDSNGVYNNYVSTANSNFRELWDMAIDCRNKSVFGMGGSTYSNQNCGSLDTLGNFTSVNFTGVTTGLFPLGYSQDVCSSVLDDNRNLFAVVASGPTAAVDNRIYRLNSNYNASVWSTATGFANLVESDNKPYVSSYASNGFNALEVNDYYVFYYDGQNIAAFDKSTGSQVGSSVSMPGYTLKRQGGIASEDCNRVYIGGNNGAVNVLSFNGTNFISLPDVTFVGVLGRKIYDVKLNRSTRQLYVCGDSFVAVKQIPYVCNLGGVQLQTSMQCPNLGICKILNFDSTSSYLYIWRDSTTHTTLKFLKNSHKWADTIVGVQPNHIYAVTVISNISCGGPSRTVAFSGNTFYASQSFTICAGQGISFGTHYYTNSGTYTDTIYQGSCATVWTTKLTVRPKYNITRTYAICSGNAVHIGNHFYYSTGNYHDTLATVYGCDSIIHSNVIVGNSSAFIQNLTGCTGTPIIVGKKTYYVNGTFIDTLYNYIYCDSVVTTHLNFYPSSSKTQHLTTCFNHPISVGPYLHGTPGIYVDHLTNRYGCDSAVTTYLAVVPYKSFGQTFAICQGSSITVGTHVYTNLGYYYDTLTSYSGCDSIVTTGLSWNPTQYSNQIVTNCGNHPLVVGSHIHSSSGFYIDTIPSSTGCDSIIFSLLTVSPYQLTTHNYSYCNPTTITVGTHSYSITGHYRDTFVNKFGCDSIIVTNLIIGNPKSFIQTRYLCKGPIAVGSHIYSLPGTYHDTLVTYLNCDSIVNTIVLAGTSTSFVNNKTICFGGSIQVGIHSYSSSGVYHDTLVNHFTCDSFVTTNLTINSPSSHTQSISICANHPYLIGLHNYTIPGVYLDTLKNYKGCDSFVTTNLAVRPLSTKNLSFNICAGGQVHIGSHYYSIGGTYKDTLLNYRGCDSIITSIVVVKPRNIINKNVNICAGAVYSIGVHSYNTSGLYHDTLVNKYGCDSIINTNLVVHPNVVKNQTITICQGQNYSIGAHNYTVGGSYHDTLVSYYLCDSIVNTNLMVMPNSAFSQSFVVCNGQSVLVGTFSHTNTGIYVDHLTNYLGCDSAVTTNLTVKPRSFNNQTVSICSNSSINIGTHQYSVPGIYKDTFTNYLACDSILTTNLIVYPVRNTVLNRAVCNGISVIIGTHNYNTTGTYFDTLLTYHNCDSIIQLNLIVNDSSVLNQSFRICSGDSVLVNGKYYKLAGNYRDVVVNSHGCDSIINTSISVAKRYAFNQNIDLCKGDSLVIANHTYLTSGVFVDTIVSSQNCDSIITTNLQILDAGVQLIAKPDSLFFDGDVITLEAIPLNSGDSVITWLPNPPLLNNGNLTNTISPTSSILTYVETINKAGCIAKDSVQLVKIDIEVPNAFTPNGDNQNDVFLLRGEGLDAVISFSIYNRWGECVFITTDPKTGWDGRYNDALQQVETYTYQIKLKNKNSKKVRTVKGSLLLIL